MVDPCLKSNERWMEMADLPVRGRSMMTHRTVAEPHLMTNRHEQ
ncbi:MULTISPECIES: hypothetical protein [unclassified Myxococcus]|nr:MULTISPECIES: hypothetical protein [unclassified Myxococcus]